MFETPPLSSDPVQSPALSSISRVSAHERSPKFPIPVTQILRVLMSTRSAEHALI